MRRTEPGAPRWGWRVAAVLSSAALLVGAALVCWSVSVGSPAARIARQAHADHLRAVAGARPPERGASAGAGPVASRGTPAVVHVAWRPTIPGQVATVTIPALEITAPVVSEGTSGTSLDIPADVHHVGWDDQTPPPGRPGVTLLAGHVNWVGQGEGALGQIGQLVAGDQVVLDWQGTQTTWTVDASPRLSPNTVVHPRLFTDTGPPTLALVTCGGPFSETTSGGSYADNVIVMAALSRAPTPASSSPPASPRTTPPRPAGLRSGHPPTGEPRPDPALAPVHDTRMDRGCRAVRPFPAPALPGTAWPTGSGAPRVAASRRCTSVLACPTGTPCPTSPADLIV